MARSAWVIVVAAVVALAGCGKKAPPPPDPEPDEVEVTPPPKLAPPTPDDPAREWDQRRMAKDPEWVKLAAASDKAAAELDKLRVQCTGTDGGCRVVTLTNSDTTDDGRIRPEVLKLVGDVAIDQLNVETSISEKGFKELIDLPGMKWVTAVLTSGVDGLTDATVSKVLEFRGLRRLRLSRGENVKLTSAAFAPLKTRKRSLHSLELPGVGVGDWAVESVAGTAQLTRLDLSGNAITDAGGSKLASFKKLESLDLSRTSIGDATLAALTLPALTQLNVSETQVTNDGMKSLAACPNLSQLKCEKTRISDAGLDSLARCATLEDLDLSSTPITDAGLKHLAKLPRLSRVSLLKTKVTRASLETLKSFPSLATANLSTSSKVTDEDVEALEKMKLRLSITLVPDE